MKEVSIFERQCLLVVEKTHWNQPALGSKQVPHFLTVTYSRYFRSVCFNFLICKNRESQFLPHRVIRKVKWVSIVLRTVFDTEKVSRKNQLLLLLLVWNILTAKTANLLHWLNQHFTLKYPKEIKPNLHPIKAKINGLPKQLHWQLVNEALTRHNSQKSNRGQYRHCGLMQWNRGHSKSKDVNASSSVSTPLWLITALLSPPASCILAHRSDPNRGLQPSNENCASNCPAGDPGLAKKGSFHSPPFWLTRWLYKSP